MDIAFEDHPTGAGAQGGASAFVAGRGVADGGLGAWLAAFLRGLFGRSSGPKGDAAGEVGSGKEQALASTPEVPSDDSPSDATVGETPTAESPDPGQPESEAPTAEPPDPGQTESEAPTAEPPDPGQAEPEAPTAESPDPGQAESETPTAEPPDPGQAESEVQPGPMGDEDGPAQCELPVAEKKGELPAVEEESDAVTRGDDIPIDDVPLLPTPEEEAQMTPPATESGEATKVAAAAVDEILAATQMEAETAAAPAGETPADAVKEAAGEEETAAPATEKVTAGVDSEAAAVELKKHRARLIARLFDQERPRKKIAQEVIQAYSTAVQNAVAAGVLGADEPAKLLQRSRILHLNALESEKSDLETFAVKLREHIEVCDKLFAELAKLIDAVAGELARLDENDEQFKNSPERLQAALTNHKKGIQIIHRMLARVRDRKKEINQELPLLPGDELQAGDPPADAEQAAEYARQVSDYYHKLRDKSFHAVQDAKELAEKCLKVSIDAVFDLSSAVDGVDNGLRNEAEIRGALAEFEEQEQNYSELIDSWFEVYHCLEGRMEEFFVETGIEPHTVEIGTRFDPETMEPQGTVADPEMNDEDVAAVLRRGFSLHGAPVRPILVVVVRNEGQPPPKPAEDKDQAPPKPAE